MVSSLWKLRKIAQRRAKQTSKGLCHILALPRMSLDNLMDPQSPPVNLE